MCVCGSGNTYQKCCLARKTAVVEKWDPATSRILHDYDKFTGKPEMDIIRKGMELNKALGFADLRPFVVPDVKPGYLKGIAEVLL
jgi:hypothetical protein